MKSHTDKSQESKSRSAVNAASKMHTVGESFQLPDNRSEAVAQRKLQKMANNSSQAIQLRAFQEIASNSPQAKQAVQLQSLADDYSGRHQQPIQKKENNTGLPDDLKSGVENLSGLSLDDVKVHYQSDKPAQLNAHAYAQGADIHIGPGQEKHLPHEAWHVVQQKQGRVNATKQMKGKVNVNDDTMLEKEADEMGNKAFQFTNDQPETVVQGKLQDQPVTQFVLDDDDLEGMWEMSDEQLESLKLSDDEKEQLGLYRAKKAQQQKKDNDTREALDSIKGEGSYKTWSFKGESYHLNLKYGTSHVTWQTTSRMHYFYQGSGAQIKDKQPTKEERGQHGYVFSDLPADVQNFIKENYLSLI
ncbi:DUF4157 domain-containing protein [Sporocytophaga myxococcoides]|uniref:eCIS core domain-containing protein n=1 Tax=Sporocytophaga myxococcoides TaxID=153721 RepID=UPI0004190BAC|nr:DUF4157 domain-containing protein [Sporocytophaga myxococcoides]